MIVETDMIVDFHMIVEIDMIVDFDKIVEVVYKQNAYPLDRDMINMT